MNKKTRLFIRLANRGMLVTDVDAALKMSQPEFLQMLIDGAEHYLQRNVTRAELAEYCNSTVKTFYGYFASESARDYRKINDDMRIAMIWRVTKKTSTQTGSRTPSRMATARMQHIRTEGGSPMFSHRELTQRFTESRTGNVTLVRGAHWPLVYLSDFVDGEPRRQVKKDYVVNNEIMSVPLAAKHLGYTSRALANRIKCEKIPPGGDISHLIPTHASFRPQSLYMLNGRLMSIDAAAGCLGYTATGLRARIKREKLSPGEDISHLSPLPKKNPCYFFLVNNEKMDLKSAAEFLGFSYAGLAAKIKREKIKNGGEIGHLPSIKNRKK